MKIEPRADAKMSSGSGMEFGGGRRRIREGSMRFVGGVTRRW